MLYACSMSTQQFKIAYEVFSQLEAEIAEINKKADKLGVQRVVLNIDSTETVKVKDKTTRVEYDKVYFLVSFTGETPKLDGWRLVAVVEPLESGENLVKIVPGEECPTRYRESDTHCEHCSTSRRRKEVFVMGHDDGRFVQVGRNCIADFLGGKSPESILRWAEFGFDVAKLVAEATDEDGWFGGRVRDSWNLEHFLATTAICVRKLGWLSRSKARELDYPGAPSATVSNVLELLMPPRDAQSRRAWERWVETNELYVEEKDEELAKATIEWASALPTDGDDYLYNLGVAVRRGFVDRGTAGLVASAIASYQRHMDRERELRIERETKVREHVGQVGVRQGFEKLTVVAMRSFESDYGVRTLVRFETEAGSVVCWWASGDPDWLNEGDVVDVTATVKEHGEYKGMKQTIVQRVAEGLPKPKKSRKKRGSMKTCPCCERDMPDVERRHRNTAYVEEELNWLESCNECFQADWEHFADMWREYYGSRL